MKVVRYSINIEPQKFLKGKPTKIAERSLLQHANSTYLEIQRRKPAKDVAWLEKLYRLEDPRRN